MLLKFLRLEWKQFFRSAYWQRSMVMNIFLGLLALYLILNVLAVGVGLYFFLKDKFPEQDPLQIVNSYLAFWLLIDLIFRYMGQKIPEAQIRPLLTLPLKKSKIAHYILLKSTLSFFVILPLFYFIPFAMILIYKGYDSVWISAWVLFITGLIMSNNYLNFIINRNDKILYILISVLAILVAGEYFGLIPVKKTVTNIFNTLQYKPLLAIIPLLTAGLLYFAVYKSILSDLYLDDLLQNKKRKINTSNLSFVEKFGDLGIFLKNDLRLLWRNKRAKGTLKLMIFTVFYGLIFINMGSQNDKPDDVFLKFIFPAVFMTGIFSFSFGLYIPAWDGAYYPFLMSQNIKMKKYLESKWLLMTISNFAMLILTLPYLYFGWRFVILLLAVTIFNMGYSNLFILWMGAYNNKKIDLNNTARFNNQGYGMRSFITSTLLLLIPMVLFIILYKFINIKVAFASLIIIGFAGLIFKNYFLNKIAQLYLKRKYKTIHGFKQQV
jgi:hypothetical protein